jgi:hypothetical protein
VIWPWSAQHYEGLPTDLVAQVANRITRLNHAGWQLDEVVLVTNGRADPDSTAARSGARARPSPGI